MADLAWHKGFQFFDDSGNPLNAGTLNVYDAGTLDARTVYKDAAAGTSWTPTITLNSAGRLTDPVYVPTGSWKYILKNAAGSTITTEDSIPGAITIPSSTFAHPETPTLTKATNYTITTDDLGHLIKADPTGGNITLTLPSAITAGDGGTLWAQHIGSAGRLTVVPTGIQTINGGASIFTVRPFAWFRLTSDGADWSAEGADRPYATAAKTADYTVTTADIGKTITVDATSAAVTVTLPTVASAADGFVVTIKRIDASTNAVTIDGNGSETIDGATTLVLSTQYEAAQLRCNGTAWYEETDGQHYGTLTEDTTPDLASDFIVTQDVSAFRRKKVKLPRLFTPVRPQGRLTLTTATPVQIAENTAATTIYYAPYEGLGFPLYNGTGTVLASIGSELSLALDSNSGHTGYHQSGKNFDLFLVNDAGTVRLASGPAWSSDTARATGLEFRNGFLCNAASMTARYGSDSGSTLTVGQDLGTYVGTFRASADGQTAWVANPAAAAGGGDCKLLVWNAYNRVLTSATSKDSTDSWSYVTATTRAANAAGTGSGLLNRISAVFGLNEDAVEAVYNSIVVPSGASGFAGVGLDSTSAFSGTVGISGSQSTPDRFQSAVGRYIGQPGLGFHFFQALERGDGGSSVTWYGDNGAPTITQMQLMLLARM